MIRTTRRPLRLAVWLPVLGFLLLLSNGARAQGVLITGYADFEATVMDPSGDRISNFDNHHFNLIGIGKVGPSIFVASEVEYEHAGAEIGLEYGYVGYTGLKNLRIMAGKFLVPFGRFNKDLHATWINKMADKPLPFRSILPVAYSDTGVWISGVRPLANGNRVEVDAYVVNGMKGESGDEIGDLRPHEGSEEPPDPNSKAAGVRIGLGLPVSGVDFGFSAYRSRYATDLDLVLVGLDAAYHSGGLELRAEGVAATQHIENGDELSKTGGYAQVAYRVASGFEPVVRYSVQDLPGVAADRTRFSVGVNYYLAASSSIRLDYHINTEKVGHEVDNNTLIVQFNVGF